MQMITLDERLSRVADMVPECAVCGDIGADHGHLSAHLLMSERVGKMYICDISAPSLDKARRLFAGDELEARALFRVGDGLAGVDEKLDACVISGMGGETIMGILERGLGIIAGATLVLQPNVDADRVRVFLYENGFRVDDEELIFDGKWWYTLIKAVPNMENVPAPDMGGILAGPVLLKKRHPLLPIYAARQVRIIKKALPGIPPEGERAAEMHAKLSFWEEVAAWQV